MMACTFLIGLNKYKKSFSFIVSFIVSFVNHKVRLYDTRILEYACHVTCA
jgi:hypothetical protein